MPLANSCLQYYPDFPSFLRRNNNGLPASDSRVTGSSYTRFVSRAVWMQGRHEPRRNSTRRYMAGNVAISCHYAMRPNGRSTPSTQETQHEHRLSVVFALLTHLHTIGISPVRSKSSRAVRVANCGMASVQGLKNSAVTGGITFADVARLSANSANAPAVCARRLRAKRSRHGRSVSLTEVLRLRERRAIRSPSVYTGSLLLAAGVLTPGNGRPVTGGARGRFRLWCDAISAVCGRECNVDHRRRGDRR